MVPGVRGLRLWLEEAVPLAFHSEVLFVLYLAMPSTIPKAQTRAATLLAHRWTTTEAAYLGRISIHTINIHEVKR